MASLLNIGRALITPPYDAEIEYLESSGTQYIDISVGFMPSTDEIYAKFSENTGQDDDKYMISSVPWNTSHNKFAMGVHSSVFTVAYDNIPTSASKLSPSTSNDGNFHTWEYSSGTIRITELNISRSNISASVVSSNLRLFYGYNATTKGKWAYYRHLRNDVPIIDLIPVRVGTTGYMYDKVSGQLFGNDGTGDFILGPDKELIVDMSLPSGTLWAKGNIVKDAQGNYSVGNETDYGCYFSWGNIDGHNAYSEDNYSFDDTNYNASPGKQLTASIPSNDAEHDAAVARLGNGWHMPTQEDFAELFNSNYTTWEWGQIDGVNGYIVTSIINGNKVFLPASGYRASNGTGYKSRYGAYWTSLYSKAQGVCSTFFTNSSVNTSNYGFSTQKWGYSIRPVK